LQGNGDQRRTHLSRQAVIALQRHHHRRAAVRGEDLPHLFLGDVLRHVGIRHLRARAVDVDRYGSKP